MKFDRSIKKKSRLVGGVVDREGKKNITEYKHPMKEVTSTLKRAGSLKIDTCTACKVTQ